MDLILVHGAWHGAWCWERVAERVRAAGHAVHAPDLAATPGADLSAHVEAVCALVERERLARFVLCGHSYGGMVATAVADRFPERVASLVYLDAFVPADGQAVLDLVAPELRERFASAAAASSDETVPPLPAARFRVNEHDRALVDARTVAQPFATFAEPLRLRGGIAGVARRVYVRAGGYPNDAFEGFAARCAGDPAWDVVELACGHDVMLDAPDELAALLATEAGRA